MLFIIILLIKSLQQVFGAIGGVVYVELGTWF